MRAEEFLPDNVDQAELNGIMVRKGSVGAFLASAKILTSPESPAEARERAERDIVDLLPALRATGLFDVLEIRDKTLRAFVEVH